MSNFFFDMFWFVSNSVAETKLVIFVVHQNLKHQVAGYFVVHKTACETGVPKGREWTLGARPRAKEKGGGERLQGSHCFCHFAY